MKCATHPQVETNLRCGKCEKPICPKCLVQTPVGARCPDCANVYSLPTYSVSTLYYLRAIGAGLGTAVICGIAWGVLVRWVPIYLNLLFATAVGYAIGEIVSLAVNRKRGTGLATIAGIAMLASYLVSIFAGSILFHRGILAIPVNILYIVLDLVALALGIYMAVTRLR